MAVQVKSKCTSFSPSPEVGFSRKEGEIPVGRHRYDKYGMELVFTDLRSEDSGVYKCEGLLGVRQAERTFSIKVDCKCSFL